MVKDGENRIQALKEYYFDLRFDEKSWSDMLEAEAVLKEKFKKVNIGIALSPFTFIPKDLFEEEKAREYLSHLMNLEKDDQVQATLVPEMNAFILFVLPFWLDKRLADLPKAEELEHLAVRLLLKAKAESEDSDQPFLWAHLGNSRVWLGAIENSELKYVNSFPFESENDALYFLLLLFDHTGLAPDRTTLHLSGKIDPDRALFKNLVRFVAQPEFWEKSEKPAFGPQLAEYPSHWFFDLLSLDKAND
jgi:hypothetical protein